MDHTKPQDEKERGKLREERDKIKFIDIKFEGWQLAGFGK